MGNAYHFSYSSLEHLNFIYNATTVEEPVYTQDNVKRTIEQDTAM